MKIRRIIAFTTMGIIVSLFLISCQSNELSKPNNEAGLNGDFETTDSDYPVNWAFFPNPEPDEIFQVSVDTTKAHTGEQSLMLATDQREETVGFRSRRVPIEPGKTYTISFALQNDGSVIKVRRIVQDISGKSNRRSDIIFETTSPTSDWEIFEDTLVVADDEANVVLQFLVDGPGTIWVDDVRVEEVIE